MCLTTTIKTLLIIGSLYGISYSNAEYSGDMTSYGASEGNQFCGFKKESWNYNNLMTAAINMPMIDNSLSCGMCAIVKYKDKKETVLLDNLCPECKYGDLDLSNQAWEKLTGNKNYGREKITWEFANCDKFIKTEKKGVVLTPHHINYWWLSITPSNFKCGINNMFIMFKDKESWIEMERKNSNMNGLYFIYHAHVQGEFKFKVLSKFNEEIETDWYSEIKEEWTLGKQFKCEQAVDCGDFSTYINTESTPSLRGSNSLNCTN